MRYDDRITFVTESEGGYNPDKGGHDDKTETVDTVPCNLSVLGLERTNELFGQIDKKIVVARTQQIYNKPFDFIRIDSQTYNVKRQSDWKKGVFYLEGVVHA